MRFARYLHAHTTREAHASSSASFGELYFYRAVLPFGHGQFWPDVPIGGDCTEVPFEEKQHSGDAQQEPTKPYSNGPLQDYIRLRIRRGQSQSQSQSQSQQGRDERPFRVSFIYGAADDMDCRLAADIAREFSGTVNGASGGRVVRVESAGHQLMVDNPAAFARAVADLAA